MRYRFYDYKCDECGNSFEILLSDDEVTDKRKCECGKDAKMHWPMKPRSRPVRWSRHEIVFDRPNAVEDTRETLRRMEENGALNTPELKAAAMTKWNAIKDKVYEKLDYQKGDHPFDG